MKWEYRGIWSSGGNDFRNERFWKQINELGADGWEMVFFNEKGSFYAVFKRELR